MGPFQNLLLSNKIFKIHNVKRLETLRSVSENVIDEIAGSSHGEERRYEFWFFMGHFLLM